MSAALYDSLRGWYAFLHDSYWGGHKYRDPSSPTIGTASLYKYVAQTDEEGREVITEALASQENTYLVPHPGETKAGFRQRISLAAYVNMVQPIVDTYVDSVTGRVTRDLGDLSPYLQRLDEHGGGWEEHVEEVARWAAVYGVVAVVFTTPRENTAQNRAEEVRAGIGVRASIVQPTAWAWVTLGEDGEVIEFAFADAPYTPKDVSATSSYEVSLWIFRREGWERHHLTLPGNAALSDTASKVSQTTLRASGLHAAGLQGELPVVFAWWRRDTGSRWPIGVSLVGDAADLCRQTYNLLSSTEENLRKTGFPFLALPTRDAGGGLDPQTKIKIGPEHALPYPADAGEPRWVQPDPKTSAEARAHAIFLLALALRLTGLDVANTEGQSPESGVALQIRAKGFEARAQRFARSMLRYEQKGLGVVGSILSLRVEPKISYPKRFNLPDEAGELARALQLLREVGESLGAEGRLAAIRQAIDAALSLSRDDLSRVLDGLRVTDALSRDSSGPDAPEQVALRVNGAPLSDG